MCVPTTPSNNSYYFAIFAFLYDFKIPLKPLLNPPLILLSSLHLQKSSLSHSWGLSCPCILITPQLHLPMNKCIAPFCLFLHLKWMVWLVLDFFNLIFKNLVSYFEVNPFWCLWFRFVVYGIPLNDNTTYCQSSNEESKVVQHREILRCLPIWASRLWHKSVIFFWRSFVTTNLVFPIVLRCPLLQIIRCGCEWDNQKSDLGPVGSSLSLVSPGVVISPCG